MRNMIVRFYWETDSCKQFLPTEEEFPELSWKLDFTKTMSAFVEGPVIEMLTWYAVKWQSRPIKDTPRYGCDVFKLWKMLDDQADTPFCSDATGVFLPKVIQDPQTRD